MDEKDREERARRLIEETLEGLDLRPKPMPERKQRWWRRVLEPLGRWLARRY